ncbi:MAG: hypothetical protein ACI8Q9_001285 [Planctomycetota bacterium]|jgi:hypothetical protein
MSRSMRAPLLLATLLAGCAATHTPDDWVVDSTSDWLRAEGESGGLIFDDGFATPTGGNSHYRSLTHTLETRHSASSLVLEQSPVWHNWTPVAKVGPSNLRDAPVMLSVGPDDYWMFGLYGSIERESFMPAEAKLDGFAVPLMTTPDLNQFDAPGGLKEGLGGYHAWQSRDMRNWVHHGPVTEQFSRWVTSAEYVDGKAYIYYDYPNDQDPHLYIDGDLTDGTPGQNMGMAFMDPTHGSDCGIIRDLQGNFHVIYEDWSPINARQHSWDSPLAGHAVSPDGIGAFEILPAAVDLRTEPTGEVAEYLHPHWKQHPEWESNVAEYNVHQPKQDAFGDWAAICIGGQYYLFSDFHPANSSIRLGWFTSSGLDEPFAFSGEMGQGHPDPDIAFAEGEFYLVTQLPNDFVSPGPWVGKVEARVGVDTNHDGHMNTWTDWTEVRETYEHIPGFSKQIKRTPAALDLSALPSGFGFRFEVRMEDSTANDSKPILDRVRLSFQ